MPRLLACALVAILALAGCTDDPGGDGKQVSTDPPVKGACRVLTAEDIERASNETAPVGCDEAHTAETFFVGEFDGDLAEADYDSPDLGAEVFRTCTQRYRKHTGADESLTLRSMISWAWFRPSEAAWDQGARWYRCDVIGGTESSAGLSGLPKSTKGLLLGIPADRWMVCVDGDSVNGATHVSCAEKHSWRAVSTVVMGTEKDPYPGDRLVEVRSRDFCSDWVGAWMNYPIDYEYAWTWFGEAEWAAGEPADDLLGEDRHVRMSRIGLGVAACLLLAGCTGDDVEDPEAEASPSSTTAATETPPEPPRANECYRLTVAEVSAVTSEARPVRCSSTHTTRTIFVGRVDNVVDGHALAMESQRVQQQLADRCPAQLSRYLGGDAETRNLSRFGAVWFTPTEAEVEAGADWFRCDVLAFGDADRLLPLPAGSGLRNILDRPDSLATYGLCGTAQPGTDGFQRVACGLRHSWTAVSTIPLAGGKRYPGTTRAREAGDEPCADEVSGRNPTVLELRYGWEWPTKEQWAAGQRYGFCWAPNYLA